MMLRRLASVRLSLSLAALGLFSLTGQAADKPPVRPLELVGREAALVCEIPQPQAAWQSFQQGEFFRRLERCGLYEELLKSDGYRQFQSVEDAVTQATGSTLSAQLLELVSQELVLTVYLSADHRPEGVLISRADSAAAVQRYLQMWQTLEPDVSPQPLKHRGREYFLRASAEPRHTKFYYVSFGPVFAISDQEARIKQVIELQQAGPTAGANSPRLVHHPAYRRAAESSAEVPAAVRLTLLVPAWESIWREAKSSDPGAQMLRKIAPAVETLTVNLRTDAGLHLEAALHLNSDRIDPRWKDWCAAASAPEEFLATVPANAVLIAGGSLPVLPIWRFVSELASKSDRDGWQKGRRMLRGFLGGRDLLDDVLPALGHNPGIYLVPAEDRGAAFPFDGVAVFPFPPAERTTGLHLALDQAFSSGLTLLSIHSADKHPDEEPATVHSEVAEGNIVRWLETSLPFRVAYRLTPNELTVSRSRDALRGSNGTPAPAEFTAARRQWFPEAGQFLWVDFLKLRSPQAAGAILARSQDSGAAAQARAREVLELFDAAYFAAKFDAGQATVRIGGIVGNRR